jgi:hypothetical protein
MHMRDGIELDYLNRCGTIIALLFPVPSRRIRLLLEHSALINIILKSSDD